MEDITYRRPLVWSSAHFTHEGTIRDNNEDAVFVSPFNECWAVADGMGGHSRGDVASQKIVNALEYLQSTQSMSQLVDTVEDRLMAVNDQIFEYSQDILNKVVMGSTFVSLLANNAFGVCLWVGDSRLYRYRNRSLKQITRDHSQVEELLEKGIITPEEALNHPQGNVITRAVGVRPSLLVDITAFSIGIGDTFLLCSDGLYNAVPEDSIAESLSLKDVNASCEELLQKALANGAKDNVSAIVVRGIPSKI